MEYGKKTDFVSSERFCNFAVPNVTKVKYRLQATAPGLSINGNIYFVSPPHRLMARDGVFNFETSWTLNSCFIDNCVLDAGRRETAPFSFSTASGRHGSQG